MWDVGVLWGVGIFGVCAHHWGPRAELCSVWEGGRVVQAQLTPKSSSGMAWPQALHHKGFAAGFSPLGLCSRKCLMGEVSRATVRKWENGGEIRRTIICVLIKYLPDGNP